MFINVNLSFKTFTNAYITNILSFLSSVPLYAMPINIPNVFKSLMLSCITIYSFGCNCNALLWTLRSAMLLPWVHREAAVLCFSIKVWGFGLKYSKWRTEEQRVKMRVQDQVIITAFYIFIFIFKHSFSCQKSAEGKRKQNTRAWCCSHMRSLNKRIGQLFSVCATVKLAMRCDGKLKEKCLLCAIRAAALHIHIQLLSKRRLAYFSNNICRLHMGVCIVLG